jgi:hypothetical protein
MCTDSMCLIIGYAVDKNQLIKTIPTFYVIRRFIIDFTKAYPEAVKFSLFWHPTYSNRDICFVHPVEGVLALTARSWSQHQPKLAFYVHDSPGRYSEESNVIIVRWYLKRTGVSTTLAISAMKSELHTAYPARKSASGTSSAYHFLQLHPEI